MSLIILLTEQQRWKQYCHCFHRQ